MPDALMPDLPPATLAASDITPAREPSQNGRQSQAVGHAPSPMPAPHAIFSEPARRHAMDEGHVTDKAAEGQPPKPSRAKRQPRKVEPPKSAAAKPALRARKSNEVAPASLPDARPKRKTAKPKIKTAERDEKLDSGEKLDSIGLAIEIPSSADQRPGVAEEQPTDVAPALTSSEAAAEQIPLAFQTDTAPTDSPVAPSAGLAEPSAAADPAADNSATADPSVSAAPASAADGAKAGSSTERRPLSDFVRQLPVEDAFRPHLEVDYFIWPTAVSALVERSGPALGSFAAQLMAQAGTGEKVLALSGGGRGEGRTSVILAVARQIAERGGRVVIVDADFEKPDLARYLGLAPEFGWDGVLQGELPLEEVLVTSLRDRVAIVPWHQRLSPGVLPFHPLRASISLGMLREHYDLVLVDGGPLLSDRKPNGLASLVQAAHFDGSYLISDCRPQAAGTLAEPLRMARNIGLRVFGAIENFSSLAHEASQQSRTAA
jgi:Mrp family chromosome partitioning ATPase